MLDNLNYKYKRRYRRARISNEEIAIKFDDFGECLLSLMDDQNYFLRGFYECIS